MKYQMPEPRDMDNTRWGYDSEDVQAAFDAGRAAGLEAAAIEVESEMLNWDQDKLLTALAKYIRNLAKETPCES